MKYTIWGGALVCLSFVAASFTFLAQPQYTSTRCIEMPTTPPKVTGQVLDKVTGNPIAGAMVQIHLVGQSTPHSISTNKNGKFSFRLPAKAALQHITIVGEGYDRLEIKPTDQHHYHGIVALTVSDMPDVTLTRLPDSLISRIADSAQHSAVYIDGVLWNGKTDFYMHHRADRSHTIGLDYKDETAETIAPRSVEMHSPDVAGAELFSDKSSAVSEREGKTASAGAERRKQKGSGMTAAERNDLEQWSEWKKVLAAEGLPFVQKWGFDMERMAGTSSDYFNRPVTKTKNIEIAMVVDATGSMGDEIEFLKLELYDVLDRASHLGTGLNVRVGSVFYQDHGDSYVTLTKAFTNSAKDMDEFIAMQHAGGGGDFPEAVEDALIESLERLRWSNNTNTEKILFLILDAPPHESQTNIETYQKAIRLAAEQNIRIIPITASGIDKNTEFLMRATAIATSGTYVFITDDSGIGNPHLKASVSEFKVEYLNDLMVRLIARYTQQPEHAPTAGK